MTARRSGSTPGRSRTPGRGSRANVDADVAVIGGGIVGITTALLLQEAGRRVVLLEAGRLAGGVSGYTTAKVSSQHGLIYDRLRVAVRARRRAHVRRGQRGGARVDRRPRRARRHRLRLPPPRRPTPTSAPAPTARTPSARRAAALAAGLPAPLVEETPLPYPVAAAVRFDDQAEFHVRKYLLALARRAARRRSTSTPTPSRSTPTSAARSRRRAAASPPTTSWSRRTTRSSTARSPSRACPSSAPTRSLCRIAGAPPEGMFISGDSPTRSVRAVPLDGEELLLVGGEGHKTGEGGDTEERYRALERLRPRALGRASRSSTAGRRRTARRSTACPTSARSRRATTQVLMATGFAKWGMTGGTAAAMILSDRVLGPREPVGRALRPEPRSSRAPRVHVRRGERQGRRCTSSATASTKRGTRPIEDLAPGEGDIVRHAGEKVAGHRRDDGTLVAVSPLCTHLGCQVNWNTAERSWDCPCHGSRFSPEGEVLHGPGRAPAGDQADRLEPGTPAASSATISAAGWIASTAPADCPA